MAGASFTFRLAPRQLLFAAILVAVAAVVLGGSQFLIGPNTAASGYLTMLFLVSVVRAHSWRVRLLSAALSTVVAVLGFVVGGLGLWATLVALVIVSLLQAFVTIGEASLLTRSPVNLLAFASLSGGGAEIWQVLLGSLIGAGVILAFAALANTREHRIAPSASLAERFAYGMATAAGSLVIVAGATLIDFPYVGWVLLSFSIMLSLDPDARASRGYLRVAGSAIGALLSVFIAMLPAPTPIIGALICLVMCVAYINSGNYALFILFLTPAVLLTTSSEHPLWLLGAYRVEAVLLAAVIAFVCSAAIDLVMKRSTPP